MKTGHNSAIRFSCPHITWTEKSQRAIRQAIDTGWISVSENVKRLEQTCSERFEVEHVIACSSATQGLAIAIRAAGWEGKTVGLPAFTWPSTLYALEANHCRPVFADICSDTWLMDSASLPEPVDAWLPVDVFGNQWLSPDEQVPAIVDAAHGFGLPQLGQRGLFEVVSLSHTKIPTGGEGGLILTQSQELAEEATEFRRLAARMSEFCAIVALESIAQYEEMAARRAEIMELYDRKLVIPFARQRTDSATSRSVYAIRIEDQELRERICGHLNDNGVEFKIYYDPLRAGLPQTDLLHREILCLPVYPSMRKHVEAIIDQINESA